MQNSYIQQLFIGYMSWAKYFSRHLGYNSGQYKDPPRETTVGGMGEAANKCRSLA
jgi:hypothetical protein